MKDKHEKNTENKGERRIISTVRKNAAHKIIPFPNEEKRDDILKEKEANGYARNK
jgi:hypothetical protein